MENRCLDQTKLEVPDLDSLDCASRRPNLIGTFCGPDDAVGHCGGALVLPHRRAASILSRLSARLSIAWKGCWRRPKVLMDMT
jgi:hypothetical protein